MGSQYKPEYKRPDTDIVRHQTAVCPVESPLHLSFCPVLRWKFTCNPLIKLAFCVFVISGRSNAHFNKVSKAPTLFQHKKAAKHRHACCCCCNVIYTWIELESELTPDWSDAKRSNQWLSQEAQDLLAAIYIFFLSTRNGTSWEIRPIIIFCWG